MIGAGRFFSGGADIKEFGKVMVEPFLPDLLLKLEAARVPVVAAIGGAALGGGLETALSCRYRIASTAASMGLPRSQTRHHSWRRGHPASAAPCWR